MSHSVSQEIFQGLILLSAELMDFNGKRIWPTKTQSFLILSIKKNVYFALTWKQSPSENYITKYYRKKKNKQPIFNI